MDLRFAHGLEKKFMETHKDKTTDNLKILSLVTLIFSLPFIYIDINGSGGNFGKIAFFRLTSFGLLLFSLMANQMPELAKNASRELLNAVSLIVFGLTQSWAIGFSYQNADSHWLYFSALPYIIVAASGFHRKVFFLVISGFVLSFYLVVGFSVGLPGFPTGMSFHTNMLILISLILLGYLINYKIESNVRVVFIQQENQENTDSKLDHVIHRLLPESAAQRIRDNLGMTANGYENTTVLFAEITGFAQLSQTLPQDMIASQLKEIEDAFELLGQKHGIEKILTDGESFWIQTGMPEYRPDHASRVAELALDMIEAVRNISRKNNRYFQVRIGIHSGPVVACLFGKEGLYIYDLYGETLGIGKLMESHGVTGQIQVSEDTHKLLQGQYAFEERTPKIRSGTRDVKTYLLLRRL